MLIGHCGDLHLSHSRYHATTKDGRNQRQQDVSDAFRRMVDGMIARKVQLVLVGGDVYDNGRPSNWSQFEAMAGFKRLRESGAEIIIATGNHDIAGVAGEGKAPPLPLLEFVGCRVIGKAERIRIAELDCNVLVVSDSVVDSVALEPDDAPGLHFLLAHGKFSASLYRLPEAECRNPADISPKFAYAALNDFHSFSQVSPNAYYSGAIEAVSNNVWSEIGIPYGWNLFDTETGIVEHISIQTRPFIDLPAFSGAGLTPAEITERICSQLQSTDITGAVIRQVVHDAPRGLSGNIDHRALKAAKTGSLHFQLDTKALERLLMGRPALVPGTMIEDDVVPPPEGFATWELYEAWCRDAEEQPVKSDDYSYADDFSAGTIPLLDVDLDPYCLNTTARTRSAA